jgi:uncharacterized protein (PEP-CTERM system associated)
MLASLLVASAGAFAQTPGADAGPKRAVSIVPRVSVTETLTDNVRLSSANKQSDLVTEISPGIRINIEGARLKGYFDYALNGIFSVKNSSPSRTQNALTTFATLEAVDNWAFVDFSGSISQQAVSAFGTPLNSNTSINANQTEVSSYRISPYVRGRLADLAKYEARYSRSGTSSNAAAASDVTTDDGVVRISGDSAFRKLGWSADASRQRVDFNAGRPTEADRLNLGLSYAITPQLSVSANGGRENNNYTSFNKQSSGTSGFGVNWSPSETTRLSASRDHRSFGETHSVSLERRTARTVWRFTDSKDVSSTPNQTGIGSLGSVSDLLFSQFASIEPDPALRARLVDAFLQANGISPNAVAISSFLTSALSLLRRQDLSFALLGVRDTITFLASRSETRRLDRVSTVIDDLSASSVVHQRGFSVNYAHRLTPDYSLGVLASQQNTSGATNLQDIRLRSLNASVTGKVGKQTALSVGLRHVVSSGARQYNESAVLGSLIVQF